MNGADNYERELFVAAISLYCKLCMLKLEDSAMALMNFSIYSDRENKTDLTRSIVLREVDKIINTENTVKDVFENGWISGPDTEKLTQIGLIRFALEMSHIYSFDPMTYVALSLIAMNVTPKESMLVQRFATEMLTENEEWWTFEKREHKDEVLTINALLRHSPFGVYFMTLNKCRTKITGKKSLTDNEIMKNLLGGIPEFPALRGANKKDPDVMDEIYKIERDIREAIVGSTSKHDIKSVKSTIYEAHVVDLEDAINNEEEKEEKEKEEVEREEVEENVQEPQKEIEDEKSQNNEDIQDKTDVCEEKVENGITDNVAVTKPVVLRSLNDTATTTTIETTCCCAEDKKPEKLISELKEEEKEEDELHNFDTFGDLSNSGIEQQKINTPDNESLENLTVTESDVVKRESIFRTENLVTFPISVAKIPKPMHQDKRFMYRKKRINTSSNGTDHKPLVKKPKKT
jgi:hypothetical protein